MSFPLSLVVYFNQRLGAAHPKRGLKQSFSGYFVLKSWKKLKRNKFGAKLSKKCFFLSLHQYAGRLFYSQDKELFCTKFVTFLMVFQLFRTEMQKMTTLACIWGAQHPNAGQNIQQSLPEGDIQILLLFKWPNKNIFTTLLFTFWMNGDYIFNKF